MAFGATENFSMANLVDKIQGLSSTKVVDSLRLKRRYFDTPQVPGDIYSPLSVRPISKDTYLAENDITMRAFIISILDLETELWSERIIQKILGNQDLVNKINDLASNFCIDTSVAIDFNPQIEEFVFYPIAEELELAEA